MELLEEAGHLIEVGHLVKEGTVVEVIPQAALVVAVEEEVMVEAHPQAPSSSNKTQPQSFQTISPIETSHP